VQITGARLDPVGVNSLAARRSAEDGEAAVLGGDEGDGVLLVVDELRG
jgi:hypothetical protein